MASIYTTNTWSTLLCKYIPCMYGWKLLEIAIMAVDSTDYNRSTIRLNWWQRNSQWMSPLLNDVMKVECTNLNLFSPKCQVPPIKRAIISVVAQQDWYSQSIWLTIEHRGQFILLKVTYIPKIRRQRPKCHCPFMFNTAVQRASEEMRYVDRMNNEISLRRMWQYPGCHFNPLVL